jgi:DNA repair photolyase
MITTELLPPSTLNPQPLTKQREKMNGKPVFTIPTKTVLNLDSGFKHKRLCSGPTFSAGTACVYSCSFCYVPDIFRKQREFLEAHGVQGRHEDIVIRREGAVDVLDRQLHAPKARALWDKPLTIYASPAVDVAGNMELVRETVEMCKVILELTKWDIRLLSKSNLLPKIAEGLAQPSTLNPQRRVIYGVSTGTLDDRLASAFEHGTPLVSKRLASLHWLQDNGFRTFAMVCPSLPQNDYDKFAREMANALRYEKCEHVWAEVLNARGESFSRTLSALSKADFHWEEYEFAHVSRDKEAWEEYARRTFTVHAEVCSQFDVPPSGGPKLRFLQYVTTATRPWWSARQNQGAIML